MESENGPVKCIGRREFIVKAVSAAGLVTLTISSRAGSIAAAFEDVTITLSAGSPLTKVGGSAYVDSSAGKLIVIRSGESTFAAFSAICTHKRGLLGYDHAKKEFECPKHGSIFDAATGSVKSGPAETAIAGYPAASDGSSVTVKVGG